MTTGGVLPPPRSSHGLAFLGNNLFLHGGNGSAANIAGNGSGVNGGGNGSGVNGGGKGSSE
jgi:hypothetical protein